jgi:hypothetical protein
MTEITPKSIVSTEWVGSPALTGWEPIEVPSLVSVEVVGVPTIGFASTVEVPSLPSSEGVGTPVVIAEQFVVLPAITSTEGLGVPAVVNAGEQFIYLAAIAAAGVTSYPTVGGGVQYGPRLPVPAPLRPRRSPLSRGRLEPDEVLSMLLQLDARIRQVAEATTPVGQTDGDLFMWLDGAWHLLPSDGANGTVLTIVGGRPCWV